MLLRLNLNMSEYFGVKEPLYGSISPTQWLSQNEIFNEEAVPKPYKRKKQKGKREADLADFPVVQIEHKLSDEECVCHCGKTLNIITEEKTSYLRFVPAHFERPHRMGVDWISNPYCPGYCIDYSVCLFLLGNRGDDSGKLVSDRYSLIALTHVSERGKSFFFPVLTSRILTRT